MGHWYDEEGNAQHYQVIKSGIKKGKKRPTTLRDAKKLNLRPSVTEIIGIMDKGDGLRNWLVREAEKKLKLDVYNWLNKEETQAAFVKDFNVDLEYVKRDYSAEGAVIHDAIEKWIKAGMPETDCPYAKAAKEVFEKYEITDPEAEIQFSTNDVGGTVDCPDRVRKIILDWKSKDFDYVDDNTAKKFVYDDHPMQLGKYRDGLDMPEDTRLINVFLSRTTAGLWCSYEHPPEEIERAGEMFELCLKLWKLKYRMP